MWNAFWLDQSNKGSDLLGGYVQFARCPQEKVMSSLFCGELPRLDEVAFWPGQMIFWTRSKNSVSKLLWYLLSSYCSCQSTKFVPHWCLHGGSVSSSRIYVSLFWLEQHHASGADNSLGREIIRPAKLRFRVLHFRVIILVSCSQLFRFTLVSQVLSCVKQLFSVKKQPESHVALASAGKQRAARHRQKADVG